MKTGDKTSNNVVLNDPVSEGTYKLPWAICYSPGVWGLSTWCGGGRGQYHRICKQLPCQFRICVFSSFNYINIKLNHLNSWRSRRVEQLQFYMIQTNSQVCCFSSLLPVSKLSMLPILHTPVYQDFLLSSQPVTLSCSCIFFYIHYCFLQD